MAVAQGYGKTVTSGSVFAYDTGDTVNSYRGEPTVNGVGNLNSFNPLDLYTWASSGNTSTWARDTSAPLSPVKGIPLKEISSGTDSYSSTYNNTVNNISAASSGQTWTVSVYALASAGTNIQVWIFGANSSGNYIELAANGFTATGVWQRISVTMTFSNGSTAYIQARVATSTNGGVIWWDGLQVEQKSYPTQFVNGTRSATQGLLPLVGNSTIDLTNVSFDSNAQMVFDGTNDRITLTPSNYGITNQFTIEVICNPTQALPTGMFNFLGTVGDRGVMCHWPWNDGNIYFDIYNTSGTFHRWYKTINIINQTALYHIMVNSSGQMIVKQNNIVLSPTGASSFSGTVAIGSSNTIGAFNSSGGNPWAGNIYMFKIYNRALTDAETTQNYRHYKTRFNLS
jgi:hypothetical protein